MNKPLNAIYGFTFSFAPACSHNATPKLRITFIDSTVGDKLIVKDKLS